MMMVGLTGGFGTGKTTVLSMFERSGAKTLNSDSVVHEVLLYDQRVIKKIKEAFGEDVFRAGRVDRKLLAKKVFYNKRYLEKLNSLVHPAVKRKVFEMRRHLEVRRGQTIMVVEVPLLFEAGFDKFFDVTIGVAAGLKKQRERLLKNALFSAKDIKARTRAQLPLAEKARRCDFVIDNNGTKYETFRQVKRLFKLISGKIT
ncbi:MAG: dephospho-CoA kinase [Candidatus Omnitrophota bacterium]